MEANTHEDDNWVKGFFLLIPSKEQEVPTLIHGDLLWEPPPSHPLQMKPCPIFYSSIHGGDCMTSGRELIHWDCAHGKAIKFPHGSDSWRICSFMAGMGRYLLDSCTLEGVPFDYTM